MIDKKELKENKAAFMTVKQIAEELCVSVRTVWRMVERGEFPKPVRYNRKLVRWRRLDLAAYINNITPTYNKGNEA